MRGPTNERSVTAVCVASDGVPCRPATGRIAAITAPAIASMPGCGMRARTPASGPYARMASATATTGSSAGSTRPARSIDW